MTGQKKAKINPKQTCFDCGERIRNRPRNVKYCSRCTVIRTEISDAIYVVIFKFRKKYKEEGYKIRARVIIKLIKQQSNLS